MQKIKFALTAKSTGDVASATITTGNPDREDDIVEPSGMDARGFMRTRSVLWAHDYSLLPVAQCIGIDAVANGLRATWDWLKGDEFADRVKNAWNQGVVNACSIGFRPLAWEPLSSGGKRFTKWELLEFSIVPVPANAEATRTLKALKLWRDTDAPILTLADDDKATVRRTAKSGRVLSAFTEQHVRGAATHVQQADAHLKTVLSQLYDDAAGDGVDADEARLILNEVQRRIDAATARMADASLPGLRRRSPSRRNADDIVLQLDDDPRRHRGEPFADPATVRALLPGIVREALKDALSPAAIKIETERQLRIRRGRVD